MNSKITETRIACMQHNSGGLSVQCCMQRRQSRKIHTLGRVAGLALQTACPKIPGCMTLPGATEYIL